MKNLLQIHIGNVPVILGDCVDSQIKFAMKHKLKIVTITAIPDQYKNFDIRTASDLMRVEYLSKNKRTLYCDWDIRLYDNFSIDNIHEHYYGNYADSIIYNGDNIKLYKEVFELMPKDKPFEEGLIFKAFKKMGIEPDRFLKNYVHFNYNNRKR